MKSKLLLFYLTNSSSVVITNAATLSLNVAENIFSGLNSVLLNPVRERELETFSNAISNNVRITPKQQTPFGPQFRKRGPLISEAEAVEDIPIDSRKSAPSLDVSPGCSLSFYPSWQHAR